MAFRRTLLVKIEDVTFDQLRGQCFASFLVSFVQDLQCHPGHLIASFGEERQCVLRRFTLDPEFFASFSQPDRHFRGGRLLRINAEREPVLKHLLKFLQIVVVIFFHIGGHCDPDRRKVLNALQQSFIHAPATEAMNLVQCDDPKLLFIDADSVDTVVDLRFIEACTVQWHVVVSDRSADIVIAKHFDKILPALVAVQVVIHFAIGTLSTRIHCVIVESEASDALDAKSHCRCLSST